MQRRQTTPGPCQHPPRQRRQQRRALAHAFRATASTSSGAKVRRPSSSFNAVRAGQLRPYAGQRASRLGPREPLGDAGGRRRP
eukprot:8116894-Alexandrium_andersonii.AAC.1